MTRLSLLLPLIMAAAACDAGLPSKETCTYEGKTYEIGDRFPAADGCNTCVCAAGGQVGCTEIACAPSCSYDGKTYKPGDSFPSTDGCNTCTCGVDGNVGCTKKLCAEMCTYDGASYPVDATFPDRDGCNTCVCMKGGHISCTAKACPQVVWLGLAPVQCNGNPWQKVESKGDGDTPAYPVKELIQIDNFFEDQGIDLMELGFSYPYPPEIGCVSCECARGDLLIVRATAKDATTLRMKYGFKDITDKNVLSYLPVSCNGNPWMHGGQPSPREGQAVAEWSAAMGAPLTRVGFIYKTKDTPTCGACSCPRGDRLVVHAKGEASAAKLTAIKFVPLISP